MPSIRPSSRRSSPRWRPGSPTRSQGRSEVEWARTADLRYGGQSWEVEVGFPAGTVDAGVLVGAAGALRGRARAALRRQGPGGLAGRDPGGAARGARRGGGDALLPARRRERRPRPAASRSDRHRRRRRGCAGADAARPSARRRSPGRCSWTSTTRRSSSRRRGRPGATRPPARSSWSEAVATSTRVDPITLQIVGNALASMADEMATTICRTAHSTVVRDGMDFSAVVCDAKGRTVAQAVSVPFHLGSIPAAMETLLEHYGDRIRPGDVFVMNDPFDGGMHLQDIFVFKPVHLERRADRLHLHDRAPRRRRRPAAGLERLRQHRDLPGGHPPALAASSTPRASRSRTSSRSSRRTCASRG